MKAWHIQHPHDYYTSIVFAETRGKAKAIACNSETFEDVKFIDLIATRAPYMDEYYQGKPELDWMNANDRFILISAAGFCCHPETFEPQECVECVGKQLCDRYQDYIMDGELNKPREEEVEKTTSSTHSCKQHLNTILEDVHECTHNCDKFARWLSKYFGDICEAPWTVWFDHNYCRHCPPVTTTTTTGRYCDAAYCEIHNSCPLYPEYDNEIEIIKSWLESIKED